MRSMERRFALPHTADVGQKKMKILEMAILTGTLLLAGCGITQNKPAAETAVQDKKDIYVPKDLEDTFVQLKKLLNPEDIEKMTSGTEDDMSQYHFGLGIGLRNEWGLWGGSRLARWFNAQGITHPDDMSGIILDSFWRHLNGKPINLEQQVKRYQDYWKKQKELQQPSDGGYGKTTADKACWTINNDLDTLRAELETSERVLGKPLDRRVYKTIEQAKQAVRDMDYDKSRELYRQTLEFARDHLVEQSTFEAFWFALTKTGKRLGDERSCKEDFNKLLALRTRYKLQKIIIPEFTIGPPATLIDAMDFLKQASRDYDDPDLPVEQRGVSTVLKVTHDNISTRSKNEGLAPNAKARCNAPVISYINVRFISLSDAIRLVCEATGCKTEIQGEVVMFVPQDRTQTLMEENEGSK